MAVVAPTDVASSVFDDATVVDTTAVIVGDKVVVMNTSLLVVIVGVEVVVGSKHFGKRLSTGKVQLKVEVLIKHSNS